MLPRLAVKRCVAHRCATGLHRTSAAHQKRRERRRRARRHPSMSAGCSPRRGCAARWRRGPPAGPWLRTRGHSLVIQRAEAMRGAAWPARAGLRSLGCLLRLQDAQAGENRAWCEKGVGRPEQRPAGFKCVTPSWQTRQGLEAQAILLGRGMRADCAPHAYLSRGSGHVCCSSAYLEGGSGHACCSSAQADTLTVSYLPGLPGGQRGAPYALLRLLRWSARAIGWAAVPTQFLSCALCTFAGHTPARAVAS